MFHTGHRELFHFKKYLGKSVMGVMDVANYLELLKILVHAFMKFSSHGAKIHRLFNYFVVFFNLVAFYIKSCVK